VVGHQHRVEQGLVPGLQIGEDQIFLQVAVEIGDLGVPARHLQFYVGDGRR